MGNIYINEFKRESSVQFVTDKGHIFIFLKKRESKTQKEKEKKERMGSVLVEQSYVYNLYTSIINLRS